MKKLFRILFVKIPLTVSAMVLALTMWVFWVVGSSLYYLKETIEAIVYIGAEIWGRK